MNDLDLNPPVGWKVTKLSHLAKVNNGKSNTQDAIDDGLYVFFDRSKEIKSSNRYLFDCEAIIVPGEGKEFIPQLYSGKFDLHQRAYAIHSFQSDVDVNYLYYYIYHNRQILLTKAVGSTVKSLRLGQFYDFPIVLPPFKQQRIIGQILSTLDKAIRKSHEIINQAELLKLGLMQDLFTKGIGHTKFKKTQLGMIPEEWEVKALNDLCSVIVDCPHTTPEYYDKGEYLVVRTPNVRDGKLLTNEALYTDLEHYTQRISRHKPEAGDVLLTREAPAGEACLVPPDTSLCLGQRMMCIRTDQKLLNPLYLMFAFYSPVIKGTFKTKSSGTTVFHFNVKEIRNLPVPLPPLNEQTKIAHILSEVSHKITVHEKTKTKLTTLKNGLMQDLLTGWKLVNSI